MRMLHPFGEVWCAPVDPGCARLHPVSSPTMQRRPGANRATEFRRMDQRQLARSPGSGCRRSPPGRRRKLADAGLDMLQRDRRDAEPHEARRLVGAVEEAVSGFDDDASCGCGLGQPARVRAARAFQPERGAAGRIRRAPVGQERRDAPAPAACAARRRRWTAAAPAPRDGRATGTGRRRAGCWPADGAA